MFCNGMFIVIYSSDKTLWFQSDLQVDHRVAQGLTVFKSLLTTLVVVVLQGWVVFLIYIVSELRLIVRENMVSILGCVMTKHQLVKNLKVDLLNILMLQLIIS